ncbi:hypothetical protein AB6A40_007073 [Gnathostoma spinigerum]|uniref:Uncharacterized protein n=1 Tax=Gnathostoma spinigerum TaxID=75299 RepID=A0ABD6EQB0_9BILA
MVVVVSCWDPAGEVFVYSRTERWSVKKAGVSEPCLRMRDSTSKGAGQYGPHGRRRASTSDPTREQELRVDRLSASSEHHHIIVRSQRSQVRRLGECQCCKKVNSS